MSRSNEPGAVSRRATGRLAPSPTGRLHLGHARSFLLAWWHARAAGGRVVLRVEDLDAARVRPGMLEGCLDDLSWLGLDWDGPALVQSADVTALQAAVDELLGRGLAYACVCSRREIQEALSAPHAARDGAGETRYPGTCRGRFGSLEEAERSGRGPAGLRFRVPAGSVRFRDAIHGERSVDVGAEVGDFLVARRDGVFAYQLAVVVDDARAGVTEVLRGDDLLASSPRQKLLQEALGLPHPTWIHVPLVVDAGGERLAKRGAGLALAELRERRVDPRALVAWAARSAGIECDERVRPGDLLAGFDLARLPREPAVVDEATIASLVAQRDVTRGSGPGVARSSPEA